MNTPSVWRTRTFSSCLGTRKRHERGTDAGVCSGARSVSAGLAVTAGVTVQGTGTFVCAALICDSIIFSKNGIYKGNKTQRRDGCAALGTVPEA